MVDTAAPTQEKGHGGVSIVPWSGLIDVVERTPELQWPLSIQVYELMRRTESQLAGILRAIVMPILSYDWFLDPNGADPKKVRVVAEDMGLPVLGDDPNAPKPRSKGRFSWKNHVRHALLSGVFGHMYFEQYGEVVDTPGLGQIWRLKKLAPRMSATIQEIKVARDGGLESIRQFGTGRPGDPLQDEIPVTQLLAYVMDREGGNWFGSSWMRAAYRHWLIKDRLLRVDAIRHERGGMGVPIVEAMQNATHAQIQQLEQLTQQYKVGEKSGGVLPFGSRLRLVGIEGTLPDTLGSIRYQDEQMSKLMLVQFLDLGTSGAGNRALGEAFIDFFDLSLQSTAQWIADTATEHQVEDQWDWNWGETDQAARIGFRKRNVDPNASVEELGTMVEKGLLVVDDEVKDWLRQREGIPKAVDPPNPGTTASGGRHPLGRPGARAAKLQLATGREVRRELYPHEVQASTDFVVIDARWEEASGGIVADWQDIKAKQMASLVVQIAEASKTNDLEALAEIEAPVLGADLIEEYMRAQAEWAIDVAIDEAARQGATIPKPDASDLDAGIADRATATALILAKGLSEAAGREALRRNAEIIEGFDVADQVLSHLDDLSDAHLRKVLGGTLTAAQNMGRLAVFRAAEATIEETRAAHGQGGVRAASPGFSAMTIYASELLDSNTCPACYGIDGTDYGSADDAQHDYPTGGYFDCDGGDWCRGTLVGVYGEAPPSGEVTPQLPPAKPNPSDYFQERDYQRPKSVTPEEPDPDWAENYKDDMYITDEGEVLKYYTDDGYADVNPLLRADPENWADTYADQTINGIPAPDFVSTIQEAVLSHPPVEPRVLYRQVRLNDGFRVDMFPEGGLVQLNGFQSCTVDAGVNVSGGEGTLEILTDEGAPLTWLSGYPDEKETLLAHGRKFRVHAILENVPFGYTKRTVIQLIAEHLA